MSKKIASLEIEPGTRIKSNLRIGPYFYHKLAHIRRYILIPFTVIRGKKKGPTLCITAGTHPTEYPGIDAAIRLSNNINPENLNGMLIIVPLVNPPGFWERNYINPIDGGNIQGSWPGKKDGTLSEKMAYEIWSKLVSNADFYLDFHGGDIPESEVGFSVFYRSGQDNIDKQSENMAKALGYHFIVVFNGEEAKSYSFANAALHGIPSAEVEHCTGGMLLEEETSEIYDGTINLMKHLKMLDGKPESLLDQKILDSGRSTIFFTKAGLYYTNIKPGELVKKGQTLGVLKNLEGEIIETIRADVTGYPLLIIHNPVKLPGDPAVTIYPI